MVRREFITQLKAAADRALKPLGLAKALPMNHYHPMGVLLLRAAWRWLVPLGSMSPPRPLRNDRPAAPTSSAI